MTFVCKILMRIWEEVFNSCKTIVCLSVMFRLSPRVFEAGKMRKTREHFKENNLFLWLSNFQIFWWIFSYGSWFPPWNKRRLLWLSHYSNFFFPHNCDTYIHLQLRVIKSHNCNNFITSNWVYLTIMSQNWGI